MLLPLRLPKASWPIADDVRRARPGIGVHDHPPRGREIRHPRGGVHGVADHLETECFLARRDDHLARVDAGMHLGEPEPAAADVQLANVIPRGERSAHRPLRIVFVRDRNAEHGHEPVAGHEDDGSPEVLDDPFERGQRRPEEPVDLFRIEGRGEGRVSREIGEQHGNELAFAPCCNGRPHVPRGQRSRRRALPGRCAKEVTVLSMPGIVLISSLTSLIVLLCLVLPMSISRS